MIGRWRVAFAGLLVTAPPVRAQTAGRLGTQLDPATRVTVQAIADSARKAGLPSDALLNKALEAAGRGADDERIVASVRGLAAELGKARKALGTSSRSAEIAAGADALHSGVAAGDLTRLRQAAGRRPLATPLMVLTDFVERGVPPQTATGLIISLAKAGVRDSAFSTFQRSVIQDIEHGADPATAATTRARGVTLHSPNPPPKPAPRPQ